MAKVHNANDQNKALNELYKRYEKRGMTYDRKRDHLEGKTNPSKSYKLSNGGSDLKKHKNGVSTKRFITDKEFADRFRASREYSPKANVDLGTTILLQKISDQKSNKIKPMNAEKNNIKKKLMAEADRNNPKTPSQNRVAETKRPASKANAGSQSNIREVARKAAKTWIPLEERHNEKIVEGKKTKIPARFIFAIIVITIALLMIVGSAVLLGSARREQEALKDSIDDLDFQIGELNTELNKKNEGLDIEFYAEEVLGMINQEHVNAEYINSNKTDGVEKHESEKASLTSLINWIFQNLK